jgi:hypothetical protein
MCSKKKILIERIIEHQIESYHDYNIIKKTLSKKNIIKKTINIESCNWDESICRTLYHFPLWSYAHSPLANRKIGKNALIGRRPSYYEYFKKKWKRKISNFAYYILLNLILRLKCIFDPWVLDSGYFDFLSFKIAVLIF